MYEIVWKNEYIHIHMYTNRCVYRYWPWLNSILPDEICQYKYRIKQREREKITMMRRDERRWMKWVEDEKKATTSMPRRSLIMSKNSFFFFFFCILLFIYICDCLSRVSLCHLLPTAGNEWLVCVYVCFVRLWFNWVGVRWACFVVRTALSLSVFLPLAIDRTQIKYWKETTWVFYNHFFCVAPAHSCLYLLMFVCMCVWAISKHLKRRVHEKK